MIRLFVRISLVGAIALMVSACSDAKFAKRILTDEGYTRIETTGYRFWNGCPKDDEVVTEFNATAPSGRHVTGVVCSGLLWGGFTRLD